MKLTFLSVGKPRESWVRAGAGHYAVMLKKYAQCDWVSVRRAAGTLAPDRALALEAERLSEAIAKLNGWMVVCDRQGTQLSSEEFAKKLRRESDRHSDRVVVMIGGSHGLDPSLAKNAHFAWSFGPGTLPHELALVVAAEQMARALSILRGDQYHK